MNEELYWIYAFNLIVNSTLTFFTMIVLIEFFTFLFRIKHPRVKVFCFVLPFVKICLDLCVYHVSNWALLYGENPVLAEQGTRNLLVGMSPLTTIRLSLEGGKTFSVADVIALSIDPIWVRFVVVFAACGSVVVVFRWLMHLFYEKRGVKSILERSSFIRVYPRQKPLAEWMKQQQIVLASSMEVTSPCITGSTILFPSPLIDSLSQEELEAIIAHESGHFMWKDCYVRIACLLIASVFWWIPCQWWQRRIEEMQERASDRMIHRFELSGLSLATAVMKTAHKARSSMLLASFGGRPASLKRRIANLLQDPTEPSLGWKIVQYTCLIGCLSSAVFGKLWIF